MKSRLVTSIVVGLLITGVTWVWSQSKNSEPTDSPLSQVGILDQLAGPGGAEREELKLSGEYRIAKGGRTGRLSVRAEMLPEWHVYSTTQKPGGPQASKILVAESKDFRFTRPFVPDRPPHVIDEKVFSVLSEHHEHEVIWTAPFELSADADPKSLQFDVKYSGQVCQTNGSCIPILKQPVEIKFAGEYDPSGIGQFQPKLLHAKLFGQIAPRTAMPGSVVRLTISAEPQKDYHVYAYAPRDLPGGVSKPTLIAWKNNQGWKTGLVTASEKPVEHASGVADEPVQYYHEAKVSWTVDLQVPEDAAPGGYELNGLLGVQTCKATGCDPPNGAEFRVVVEVAKLKAEPAPEPLSFTPATYDKAAKLVEGIASTSGTAQPSQQAAQSPNAKTRGSVEQPANAKSSNSKNGLQLNEFKPVNAASKQQSMLIILPTAFLAGFLLNFMPCVLPVIGLKIVSFVNQSGESRSRIFMLNFWYAVGVISVFMVLAGLAVFAGFSWGDQFRSATFNVVLACVVFAFALSFLGVWEIPLPGFVGSSGTTAAAEQEGVAGAFFKGALSTVLATPCGGPMLAPALTWAVAQPPLTAFLGFACVGIGMASPYLLVGAFPRLIAFLPKPGDWMETFKHIMGFVLMGTVVFVLTVIPVALVVPTVAMMIGLWAALWWVGRVPVWEELNKRVRAWAGGTAFATLVGLVSYMWLDDVMASRFERDVDRIIATRMSEGGTRPAVATRKSDGSELPWQPYSHELLAQMIAEKRTVFVDFTADWCATCKLNERVALNVADTIAFVAANNIATLKADMTTEAPDADELKAQLGGGSVPIPYYAVFPASAPNSPIVFDGPLTKSRVLDTLKRAIGTNSGTATAEVADNRKFASP